MTLAISLAHHIARLNATLAFMGAGEARARLLIYAGARPALGDAPIGSLLVEMVLMDPPGEVVADTLILTPTEEAMVMVSGVATWARIVNGAGALVLDGDVSDPAGEGEVMLPTTQLYAGGYSRLVSAVLR